MQPGLTKTQKQSPERAALRFFHVALVVFAFAAALAWLLVRVFPPASPPNDADFPVAFWFSSVLLLAGSAQLVRATLAVRRERQTEFRRALFYSIVTGTLFLGVQSYGLTCLLQQQHAANVTTAAGPFVFVISFLHGMHFVVAMLFLVFVTVRAFADRYDHEYYWGVTICSYFWHVLGIVWLAILSVFAIIAI